MLRSKPLRAALGFCVPLAATAWCPAAQNTRPASSPATTRGNIQALTARVAIVKGIVQVSEGEGKPWVEAKVGMELGMGAKFRTGPKSSVTFTIPPNQIITLDRLGVTEILRAIQEGSKLTTNLGMEYGRIRYDIEAAGLQHDATIASPSSSMAVRGTDVIYQDDGTGPASCYSVHGRVQFRNLQRQFVAFGDRRPLKITAEHPSAAATALRDTRVQPKGSFSGLSDSEQAALDNQPAIAGTFEARLLASIAGFALAGFEGDDVVGVIPLPGPLAFDLVWEAAKKGGGAVDLNLSVTDPQGQTASITNLQVGKGEAIGIHDGDFKGKNGIGAERVQWSKFFQSGTYTIRVVHASGVAARTFVIVRQDETIPVGDFGTDPNNPIILRKGQEFTTTVDVSEKASPTTGGKGAKGGKGGTPTNAKALGKRK